MIGWSKEYNCANYAIECLNKIHGLDIKVENGFEWQSEFIPYIRKWFRPSKTPVDHCLVVMRARNGELHLGMYRNYMIEHNYKPMGGCGSVIKSDLGTIKAEFDKRVRFYVVN